MYLLLLVLAVATYNAYQLHRLERIMAADKAALDAKIDEVISIVEKAVADFQAKIDAGAQAVDFQPEVDKLQSLVDAVKAADPVSSATETPQV
jgi:hypothetical protein